MGRRSLATERTEQILDAFGRCVARYGLEGSTLELIAEEAGMRRSILRHYIGNRDELIHALADRVINRFRSEFFEGLGYFAHGGKSSKTLVNFLLPDTGHSSVTDLLVIEALIGAAPEFPKIRKQVAEYVEDVVREVSKLLRSAYPSASAKQCWTVSYGVVCIVFNHDSLVPLKLSGEYLRAARKTSMILIESLGRK